MTIYNMIKTQLDTSNKDKRLKAYELSESYVAHRFLSKYNINFVHFNKDDPYKMDFIHIDSNTLIDIKCQTYFLINNKYCFSLKKERLISYYNECNEYPLEDNFTGIIIYHCKNDDCKFITIDEINFFAHKNKEFIINDVIYIPIDILKDEIDIKKYFDSKHNVKNINSMNCKSRFIYKLNLNKIDFIENTKLAHECLELNTKIIFFETLTSKFSRYNENEKLSFDKCLIMSYEKYKYILNLNNCKEKWICYLIKDLYDKKNNTLPILTRELVFLKINDIESQNKINGSTIIQKNGKYINFTKFDSIKEKMFFKNYCGDDKKWKLDF